MAPAAAPRRGERVPAPPRAEVRPRDEALALAVASTLRFLSPKRSERKERSFFTRVHVFHGHSVQLCHNFIGLDLYMHGTSMSMFVT